MPEARKFVRPRLPLELADRIDLVRGDVAFERWVRRALEAALGPSSESSAPDSREKTAGMGSSRPASPRAPEFKHGLPAVQTLSAGPPAAQRPTAAQLANRTGVTRMVAQRALDDGTWEKL